MSVLLLGLSSAITIIDYNNQNRDNNKNSMSNNKHRKVLGPFGKPSSTDSKGGMQGVLPFLRPFEKNRQTGLGPL